MLDLNGCLLRHPSVCMLDLNLALPCTWRVSLQVEEQQRKWPRFHIDLVATSPQFDASAEDLVWAMECVLSRVFSGPYSGAAGDNMHCSVWYHAATPDGGRLRSRILAAPC